MRNHFTAYGFCFPAQLEIFWALHGNLWVVFLVWLSNHFGHSARGDGNRCHGQYHGRCHGQMIRLFPVRHSQMSQVLYNASFALDTKSCIIGSSTSFARKALLRRKPLGSRTLGSRTLGSRTLGSRTLESRTLGSRTLESRTLESRTLGSRTLESRTLGSRTLGSRTLESRTLESRTLGSRTPGNRRWHRGTGFPRPVFPDVSLMDLYPYSPALLLLYFSTPRAPSARTIINPRWP